MPNKEHLDILNQGVWIWNQWREENPGIQPDLMEADLNKMDLSDADLSRANLIEANLNKSYLIKAYLNEADLSAANLVETCLIGAQLGKVNLYRANLYRANLWGTYLGRASLREADLTEADLSGAKLFEANFTNAILKGANFENVFLEGTIFGDINLANVKGLELCQHFGPSIIDHWTLIESGRLPLSFLRGCGLPDSLIDYLPSLLNESIQFYSCFISYSSKDEEFAKRLYADLQNKGIRCWFAPEDLKIGDKFRTRIDESIRLHDKLLLVLSEHSVMSDWVEKEVETAMERERKEKRTILFPIRLDNKVMEIENGWPADIRRTRHIGDFQSWKDYDEYQKAFNRLLRNLKAEKGL